MVTSDAALQYVAGSKKEERWPWIWFAYSAFLFLDPIFAPSWKLWEATLVVFVVFFFVFRAYVLTDECNARRRFWLIGATVAMGLASMPWNGGASCLFVFAASFVAFTMLGIKRILFWFAVIAALVLAEAGLLHHAPPVFRVSLPNALVAIFLLAIIGGSNILFAEQNRNDQKLRAAQEENVTLAALAERERIARDLHDVLGHTLSVIALKAELAGRLIALNPVRAAAEIGDVERMTRTALGEVREAIVGYRAQGLAAEMEAARRTLDAAGVTLVLDSDADLTAGTLSANEETVLSLALREAVTNIVRHAKATTCRLQFVATPDAKQGRRLVIEDDGAHAERKEGQGLREGNGLRGMRERVESLGGKLQLESGFAEARGTRLSIELPMFSAEPEVVAA